MNIEKESHRNVHVQEMSLIALNCDSLLRYPHTAGVTQRLRSIVVYARDTKLCAEVTFNLAFAPNLPPWASP